MATKGGPGFSLLETLVTLSVMAVLAALGLAAARPSPEAHAARALRALFLQARADAVWSGAPVAVVELPGGAGFAARRLAGDDCASGEALATVRLREFPGVRVAQGLWSGGLYWLPTGAGRACSGGGVISGTVVLQGPLGSASVVVSSLGRVRVEVGR